MTEVEGSILQFEDLMAVERRGNNLVAFQNKWDSTKAGMQQVPIDSIFESLHRKQIEKSVQLKKSLA